MLSDDQAEYMLAWLRRQADSLGLKDWRIRVSPFEAEKDADASSLIADESESMVIAVGRTFLLEDADEQRAILTHELLHGHFQPIARLAWKLVETELGRRTEAIMAEAVKLLEERTVDRLARAIALVIEPFAFPTPQQEA